MTVTLHWFLPTAGDSRDIVGNAQNQRPATFDYIAQVASAAEQLGFAGVLTPTGTFCEDAWVMTSALLDRTRRLKYIVALRPGLISPMLAGQMASTFQRVSQGRLLMNVVTGGDQSEQQRFGDWLSKDERYARTDEFLGVLKGVWGPEPLDFEGQHYRLAGATTHTQPNPRPPIYFGGASSAAERVAARHADVYLAWGEPPELLQERIERVSELPAAYGRTLRFGIRLHVITRERSADAWAETERLLAAMDDKVIESTQSALAQSESVGQQRVAALHGGRKNDLVIARNLWAGIGLVRGGAGTALVGSHEEIVARLADYHELGFDEFILSGHPHLEEGYAFGEGVMPLLRESRLVVSVAQPDRLGAPTAQTGAYFAPAAVPGERPPAADTR